MLTEDKMVQIANEYIKSQEKEVGELIAPVEAMIRKDYGIYFRYVLKIFYDTKDEKYNILLGNAPFLVENKTGKVVEFGTSRNIEYYMKEYETGRWPVK